jgi:hypothetical protein
MKISYSAAITVNHTAEEVYRFIADDFYSNYPRWSPEVRRLQPLDQGPLRVGSKVLQVRVDQGRRSETVFQVQRLEKGRLLHFKSVSGPKYAVTYRLEPTNDATEVQFLFEVETSMMMRPFEKLIRQAVKKGVGSVTTNLKALLDGDRVTSDQQTVSMA